MTPSIAPATADMEARVTSGSRLVKATPAEIFDLLADPSKHALIDGSGTVQGSRSSDPERLSLGATFGMNMKMGVPYPMQSTVSEFVENEVIEWHHFGRHRWRYELAPVDGGTMVTERFIWGTALLPAFLYEMVGYPERHRKSIDSTLERLAQHFAED